MDYSSGGGFSSWRLMAVRRLVQCFLAAVVIWRVVSATVKFGQENGTRNEGTIQFSNLFQFYLYLILSNVFRPIYKLCTSVKLFVCQQCEGGRWSLHLYKRQNA